MKELETWRFLLLPLELQETIISQRDQLLLIFSQVNLEYQALLGRALYNSLCDRCPSKKEFENDTVSLMRGTTQGKIISMNEHNSVEQMGYLLELYCRTLTTDHSIGIYVEIIFDTTSGITVRDISSNRDLVAKQRSFYMDHPLQATIDSLTYYTIRSNRLNCMRVQPDYAKAATLEFTHGTINLHNEHLQDPNMDAFDFKYVHGIISLYSYLILNAYTLGIPNKAKLTKLEFYEENIDEIKAEIDYLSRTIKQKISAL